MIQPTVSQQELDGIVKLEEHNPASILGPKIIKGQNIFSIRAYLPRAVRAWVILDGELEETMKLIDPQGFYEVQLDSKYSQSKYLISLEETMKLIDPQGFYEVQLDSKYSQSKYLISFE